MIKRKQHQQKQKPQSPEFGAGTGFTFEDAVSAFFLSALLGEGYAPGIDNRTVCRVALQQRNFGEPLDDLIVDFCDATGELARLSLQVKRGLTLSSAKSNIDFREIIRDSWLTYQKPDFRRGTDRYGAAVGEIAKDKARAFTSLCELARASVTTSHFQARFAIGGNASAAVKAVKKDIVKLLRAAKGRACSGVEVHGFLAHFVLLEFDFLHGGATDPSEAMIRLRECLAADQFTQAPLLWTALRQMARDAAGKAGTFDRPILVHELSRLFRLRAAPSLREDMQKLLELARSWVADIQNDVGGTHLNRASLAAALEQSMTRSRFVQIRGLPGSGKSVLLRQRIEADLARGPLIFLKSDRLAGNGWASFATANGLSNAPLTAVLTEIGAIGIATLFVDGIDRIGKEHQLVVLDVIRAILRSPLLSEWKIVVSLRDSGIEPLRNWMAEALNALSITTVEVNALSDEESESLATSKPALRGLLFGPAPVREIVRRPFFAKILSQSFGAGHSGPPFEPQSEVDLIDNWWVRGGYDSFGQDAIARQRAIIELGALRARQLSQPISLSQLSATATGLIEQLIADGILQHERLGHTVRFAHDIFFEWSFFHALSDLGDQWLEKIRECGEPPAVARVVELMSQWEYRSGQRWATILHLIATAKMRSQWTRAWLLGPFGVATIEKNELPYAEAVLADESHLLKKALVWFQAEKTTPNPNILAGAFPPDERVRIADLLGWPADFAAWRRLIAFLLRRIDTLPVALYPDVVSVFEVWQNALAGLENRISTAALNQSAAWLREIDGLDAAKTLTNTTRWEALREVDDFRRSLARLILRAAAIMPKLTEEYVKRVIGIERLEGDKYKEIIDFSPTLAATHPHLLVGLTIRHLAEELPDDVEAHQRQEMEDAAEARREALAKPETERTERDNAIIKSAFSGLGIPRFSYHDWHRLSIDDDTRNFYPPSPLREPFHSLFKASSKHAIELLTELCNHAITAWRQLHRHVHDSPGTPLPMEIRFPWGIQQFWGGAREYLWHRGNYGPKPVACAFMALEEWCFAELERGRPVDELIQQIVEGNKSIAILGTAIMLALHTERLSETVLPLITAQRLWSADENRALQDMSSMVLLSGFTNPSDLPHVNAIKTATARLVRKKRIRFLAAQYFLSDEFGERTKATIVAFKDNLPFEIEEHRSHPQARQFLTNQALEYGEIADKANYWLTKPPNDPGPVEVVHVSPSAAKPENVAKLEAAKITLQEQELWFWASKAFETGKVAEPVKIPLAIKQAKRLDGRSLYTLKSNDDKLSMRRGAVAATAALVLRFREDGPSGELAWARKVLGRAFKTPEARDIYWSPQSVIPWHQAIFAARGFGADLHYGTGGPETAATLLALVAHPLEAVSLAALEEAATLWKKDPKLVWAALILAFTLCRLDPRPRDKPSGPGDLLHSAKRMQEIIDTASEYYEHGSGWPDLPLPPPAWIRVEKPGEAGGPIHEIDSDDLEKPNEIWSEPTTHWYSQYAANVLKRVPFEQVLVSEAKGPLLTFIAGVLQWTNAKNAPPWLKKGKRDRESSRLYEWTHELGATLGGISGLVPMAEVRTRFLEPIFGLEGDTCWALLAPFVSSYICRYIYDARQVADDAVDVLSLCLERFLKSPSFKRSSYRSGEFYGFDEPRLLKLLMFVSVERADLAARYVNGDWSEIKMILPLVDRFVRAGGWSVSVMSQFLTLCERSKSAYPAEMFADQVLAVIGDGSEPLKGWHGTFIPARIAGLVQFFADRHTPMSSRLGQPLLRVLDLLVDMGDRRSAALQLSETFREIKIG